MPAIFQEILASFFIQEGTYIMNISTRQTLVVASVVSALLVLLFGGGNATGTMMSGGMISSGSIGAVCEMLIPFLLFIVLGVVIFSAIFERKNASRGKGADV